MVATQTMTSPDNRQELFRISYASRAKDAPGPAAIARLAQDSARRNLRRRVSGVMLHGGGVHLQWLEGPGDEVCADVDDCK